MKKNILVFTGLLLFMVNNCLADTTISSHNTSVDRTPKPQGSPPIVNSGSYQLKAIIASHTTDKDNDNNLLSCINTINSYIVASDYGAGFDSPPLLRFGSGTQWETISVNGNARHLLILRMYILNTCQKAQNGYIVIRVRDGSGNDLGSLISSYSLPAIVSCSVKVKSPINLVYDKVHTSEPQNLTSELNGTANITFTPSLIDDNLGVLKNGNNSIHYEVDKAQWTGNNRWESTDGDHTISLQNVNSDTEPGEYRGSMTVSIDCQ